MCSFSIYLPIPSLHQLLLRRWPLLRAHERQLWKKGRSITPHLEHDNRLLWFDVVESSPRFFVAGLNSSAESLQHSHDKSAISYHPHPLAQHQWFHAKYRSYWLPKYHCLQAVLGDASQLTGRRMWIFFSVSFKSFQGNWLLGPI